jgi:hypothetical protein
MVARLCALLDPDVKIWQFVDFFPVSTVQLGASEGSQENLREKPTVYKGAPEVHRA